MIVLVCGGRNFQDDKLLRRTLDFVHRAMPITKLIHGGARGADTLAGRWAWAKGIPVEVFVADWDRYGKKAGSIRNGEMLEVGKPHAVIAFEGGRGTEDMCSKADVAGVHVLEVVRE
jgi:hypothetical protein